MLAEKASEAGERKTVFREHIGSREREREARIVERTERKMMSLAGRRRKSE